VTTEETVGVTGDQPAAGAVTAGGGETVDVVVVTYSPGESLTVFLDTLGRATSRPVRVVMADNGSVDGAPEAAAAARRAELLPTGANLGYGGAANRGAALGHGEWLVVANPDVEWAPGSLDALLDAGRRWERAGALGPMIVSPDGSLYPSARALPSLGRGVGHALLGWFWPANPWTRSYRQEADAPTERVTGWLSGSCLLLRRAAFDEVGGFDDGYFMFFEDLDLCERLAAAGWSSVYVPSARVVHEGGHSWKHSPDAMVRAHHRSAWRYASRRWSGPRYAPLRSVLWLGLEARYLLSRIVRRVGEGAVSTRRAPEPPPAS
jgi:N-acetylglucosaminyl-diphospho-decaprenol L-rhamnosyltransferase